ncbi:unnamed protein product [Blepharisma stoltei]|uniref:FHA domain-containing protein n=1 Tax=Blepharisma stoltei TaxID=1481888 RepID=A0AAU9IVD6_9CILI|nr:unnamed protein product [Blepharisma stoltei]
MQSGMIIQAKIATWERDSHELYDYNTNEIINTTITTSNPCYLLRNGNELQFSQSLMLPPSTHAMKYDSKIYTLEKNIAISPVDAVDGKKLERNRYEKLWLVVNALKPANGVKGYKLAEGDVIRLGRLKFRVKELKGTPSPGLEGFSMHDMMSINDGSDELQESPSSRMFKLPCKICLSEANEIDNPLIAPCMCAGTMKYIHIKCLQQFLRSKLSSRSTDSTISFSWKKLCCDLCKKAYPYKIVINKQIIELVEIPKPPGQYIIIECLCKDKNSNKGLHVISFCNKSFVKMGRGQDCELRANDISVSRLHAVIKFDKGSFYLQDKGGKYGTLIQIKRPIILDTNLVFQCGRSLVKFNIKKQWSLIPSCFRVSYNFDSFARPYPSSHLPLLPMNTGIPLSVNDPYELLARAGLTHGLPEDYKTHNNLLFEHKQLGLNSSYEGEDDDPMDNESIEEVQMAELSDVESGNEATNRYDVSM